MMQGDKHFVDLGYVQVKATKSLRRDGLLVSVPLSNEILHFIVINQIQAYALKFNFGYDGFEYKCLTHAHAKHRDRIGGVASTYTYEYVRPVLDVLCKTASMWFACQADANLFLLHFHNNFHKVMS